jgi:hypothetical protein
VRLIGIAELVDGVEDRHASLQEGFGLAGAFDAADVALGRPGRPKEAPAKRTR